MASRYEIQRLQAQYWRDHWGLAGDFGPYVSSAPDPSGGVVLLGELVAVEYATEKGDDGPSIYRHTFERSLPALTYCASGLVVVRARSRYRITSRGIEG